MAVNKDGVVNANAVHQGNNSNNFKEKNNEGEDSDDDSNEDSDHESECTQPEEVNLFFIKFLTIFLLKNQAELAFYNFFTKNLKFFLGRSATKFKRGRNQ